ncbi:MAG: diguanylate cyclase [Gammaproteobacteria bacterium]|nr:diguanylate cyclase [Gammaproteobacteria bacterium]
MSQNNEFATICLQHAPCGMLVLDPTGTVVESNPRLREWLGRSESELTGASRESLEKLGLKGLFASRELAHLAPPGAAEERWLLCSEHRTEAHTIRFYLDISRQVRAEEQIAQLQQQVEDLTITDALTGLANPRALNRALNSQVTRSRRYNNPLCLVLMELGDSDNPVAVLSDEQILAASRYLRDRLRWVDTIARWDHNHFLIILPETHTEDGIALIEKICHGFQEIASQIQGESQQLSLRFGLAQWLKGNDSRMLMDRAAASLNASLQGEAETAVN